MSLRETHEELCCNSIVYTYPGGQMDIICASDMVFHGQGWEESCGKPVEKAKRQKGKKSEGDDMLRSMRRARANLRRLALSNDFQYFVTLTLDPAKMEKYGDIDRVRRALNHSGVEVTLIYAVADKRLTAKGRRRRGKPGRKKA